jgi:hypothetical protein
LQQHGDPRVHLAQQTLIVVGADRTVAELHQHRASTKTLRVELFWLSRSAISPRPVYARKLLPVFGQSLMFQRFLYSLQWASSAN